MSSNLSGASSGGSSCLPHSFSLVDSAKYFADLMDSLEEEQAACETATKISSLQLYRMTYAKDPGTEGEKLLKQTKYALQTPSTKLLDFLEFVLAAGLFSPEPKVLVFDVHVGACSSQGGRDYNEDFCAYDTIQMGSSEMARFYGMYDGHSDKQKCACFVARELPRRIETNLQDSSLIDHQAITDAIIKAVHDIEEQWHKDGGQGGTTATCALELNGKIYVINVGDSRTVLYKKEKLYQLSEDAKPDDKRFKSLVEKMGNYVSPETMESVPRVNEIWALARDIGVPVLSPRPKITFISAADSQVNDDLEKGIMTYQQGDLLLLTTDGLLDNITNDELSKALQTMDERGDSPLEMAKLLVQGNDALIQHGGTLDNTTVMVVRL